MLDSGYTTGMVEPMSDLDTTTLDTQAAHLLAELERLQKVAVSAEVLPTWLPELSRVKCEIQTLWAEHFLATLRDSNDEEAQDRYKRLMRDWIPKMEANDEPLARLALSAGLAETHPGYARQVKAEITGEQNQQLLAQLAEERLLSRQYDKITTNQMVHFEGSKLTAREAQARLESTTEAGERAALWQAIKQSKITTSIDLDALFLQLLRARQRLATLSGNTNYAEYIWQKTNREYTIRDAVELLDGISDVFADVITQADRERANRLGVEKLRPWDLTVRLTALSDVKLSVAAYISKVEQVFEKLDGEFGAVVRGLRDANRLDLAPRLGKSRGDSSTHLYAFGTSEILCNLTGNLTEFGVLFHEIGHAIHKSYLSNRESNLIWDFYNFNEISEFYAYIFQFIGGQCVLDDQTLSPEDRQWYRRFMLEGVLSRIRSIDGRVRMELWLYQQTQNISIKEIDTQYLALYERPGVDWSNNEDYLRKQWQQRHLFLSSFYNIEYSIARIAALIFMQAYKQNPSESLILLKQSMKMGATEGLTTIFKALRIHFPFSKEQTMLARDVLSEWLT
jgi:oligoendopeptidase F